MGEFAELFARLFSRMGAVAFAKYGVLAGVAVVLVYFALHFALKLLGYAIKRREELNVWFRKLGSSVRVTDVNVKPEAINSLICAAVLVIAALGQWPYFIYVLLRLFICGSSAYIASLLRSQHRVVLAWVAAAIALLYNPILPVRMARSDWAAINILTAVAFVAFSAYRIWETRLRQSVLGSVQTDAPKNVIAGIDARVAEYVERAMREDSWIEHTAANFLADEQSKNAFYSLTRESPAMKLAFHNAWGRILSPERPLTRGRLTIIFNEVGIQLAGSGDLDGSVKSFACSSLFIKENPLRWAALAEVAQAEAEKAKWAEKVIKFRLRTNASPELKEFLATEEAKALLRHARQRMQEIIANSEEPA